MTSQAIVSYFNNLKLFQLSRNTWVWAMDIALYVEYGGGCEDKKGEDSLTSTRRINGLYGDAH